MSTKIVFFHGLFGSPDSPHVWRLRAAFGNDAVTAPGLAFGRHALSNLSGLQGLTRLRGLAERALAEARAACDAAPPSLIIGQSLGGAVALHLAHERDLPCVLLCPAWNAQLSEVAMGRMARQVLPAQAHGLAGLLAPVLLNAARSVAGFRPVERCPTRTLVLHSPGDGVVDIEQSRRLLAASPIAEGDPHAAFMDGVVTVMRRAGHPGEGRLFSVGADHWMYSPDAAAALVHAARLMDPVPSAVR